MVFREAKEKKNICIYIYIYIQVYIEGYIRGD